jgi:pectate lyase
LDAEGSRGDTITVAVAGGFDDITVVGTCMENVEIRQGDVTIQGGGTGGTVVGQLFVNGARRVTIQNLSIQRDGAPGSHGILALTAPASGS